MSHVTEWLIENPPPYLTIKQARWRADARRAFEGVPAIAEIVEILRFGHSADLCDPAAELALALGFQIYGSCDDCWLQTTWRLFGPGGVVVTIEPMWPTPLPEEYAEGYFELFGEDEPDLPNDHW